MICLPCERSNFPHRTWRATLGLFIAFLLQPGSLPAEPVAVRYMEGTAHGFLVLRSMEGKIIASGDLIQRIHGDRVTSRLAFTFTDGSVDDERAVFSQRGHFRLIYDHHIQKGPMFPKPSDITIHAVTGEVTVRYQDKGREKIETSHLDLPPDLVNGIILTVVKNVPPDVKEMKLSYLAADPKPRLVKLSISPDGEGRFSAAGAHHKAIRFKVKIELGGISGLIAPMVGKQPADTNVWMSAEEPPAFLRYEGLLYSGGPTWSIAMTIPVWPQPSQSGITPPASRRELH